MLRQFFIYLSRQRWAYRAMLSNPLTRAMAWRFVAGEDLQTTLGVVRDLNARGIQVTLDHLGENVTSEAEAIHATDEAIAILRGIATAGVRSHLSVKPTQLGFDLGDDFCREQLCRILAVARE